MKPWAFALLCFVCLFTLGCSEDAQVRTYTVAKKPAKTVEKSSPAQTLGVIYPNQSTAWFLKLMDSPEKVEPLATQFRQLANAIQFDATGEPNLPTLDGWTVERPQQVTGFEAFAKFNHASGAFVALTKLGANTTDIDEWKKYLVGNINRWRDQLGLPPQDWNAMVTDLEEFPSQATGEVKAYFVNLKGIRKAAGAGMGGAPFLERMRAQQQSSIVSPSPETQASSNGAAESAPQTVGRMQLKYEVPTDWKELPASGIRLATFEIQAQDQSATVSISTSTGKVPDAVGMWLQQIGKQPDQPQIDEVINSASQGTANNIGYRCYQLQNEGSSTAIRVIVIPLGGPENLYVKMTGPMATIQSQVATMDKFVSSLSW